MKRFNFVNNKWVKSQKVVNFPFKDFDPTPYLASVPQETILRHKELLDHHAQLSSTMPNLNSISLNVDDEDDADDDIDEIVEFDRDNFIGSIRENESAEDAIELDIATNKQNHIDQSKRKNMAGCSSNTGKATSPTKRIPTRSVNRRKRLVSTSLMQTPVIDGEFNDFHNHKLQDGQDPYDLKYQLYAVVVSIFFVKKMSIIININCMHTIILIFTDF